jgi:threonine/homoserine/homoserine lactone efflux protein
MIFKVILGGMTAGLIMTIMTGPAFFSLIRTSISKGFIAGLMFALGVFFADSIFVTVTFLGASLIALAESNQQLIGMIGAAFLLFIGINYLRKKAVDLNEPETASISKLKHTGYFLKGMFMNLLNPGMLFYWIGLVSYLGTNPSYNRDEIFLFVFAAMFTVLSTDLLKAYFASKARHLFNKHVILWMNRVVGIALIVFAVVIVVKVLFFSEII